jgi:hypothetical protein
MNSSAATFSALEKYTQNPKNLELVLHGKELRCQKKTKGGTSSKVYAFLKEFFKSIPCDSKKEFTIYLHTLQKMPKGDELLSRQISPRRAQKIKALWNEYKKENHSKEGVALFQKLLARLPKEQAPKALPLLPKAPAPKKEISLPPEEQFLDRIRGLHTVEELENYVPQLPALKEAVAARPDLYSRLFQVERFIAKTKELRNGTHSEFILKLQSEFLDKFSKRQSVVSCLSELGQFLYLLEQNRLPSPITFESLKAEVKKSFPKILEPQQKKDKNLKTSFALQEENALALSFAKLLVNKNGTINTFLIPALRKHSIKRPYKNIPLWSRLDNALIEIKNNANLCPLLEAAKIPASGSQGEKIIRDTLLLSPSEKISKAHVVETLLSAIFAPWFQDGLGSCHTTALLMAVRSTSLEMTVKEYIDILESGKLTRTVHGKKREFPGLYRPTFVHLYRLVPTPDSSQIPSFVSQCTSIPHVHSALALLTGNKKNVQTFLSSHFQKLLKNKMRLSNFYFLLEEIKKKYKPKEAIVRMAKRQLAASCQHPLLRTWENSAMGMQYHPLSLHGIPTIVHQKAFSSALVKTFAHYDKSIKYNKEAQIPKEWQYVDNIYFAVVPEETNLDLKTILLFKDREGKFSEIKNKEEFGKLLQKIYEGIPHRKPLWENSHALALRFVQNYHPKYPQFFNKTTPWQTRLLVDSKGATARYLPLSQSKSWNHNKAIITIKKCDRNFLKKLREKALSLYREALHSKNFTLPISSRNHAFRILPLHSSLVSSPQITNADRWIRHQEQKILSLKLAQCPEIASKLKKLFHLAISRFRMEKIFKISPKETLTSWAHKIREAFERLPSKKDPIMPLLNKKLFLTQLLDSLIYQTLIEKMPKIFSSSIIHFAHTNSLDSTNCKYLTPLHYSFLFSPSMKKWTVQVVSANNKTIFPPDAFFIPPLSYFSEKAMQPLKEYGLRKKRLLIGEKRALSTL